MYLALQRCTDPATWDAFLEASPQGVAFNRWDVLRRFDTEVDCWFLCHKDTPKLAVPILHKNGAALGPHPFGYYQGPMIAKDVWEMRSIRRHGWIISLMSALGEQLTREYNSVFFTTHWTLQDVRGISWLNFHDPANGRFALDVRYTAIIDPSTFENSDHYIAEIRRDRRQDLKYAAKADYRLEVTSEPGPIVALYRDTLEQKYIPVAECELSVLLELAKYAAETSTGETLLLRSPSGEVLAAQFLLYDSHYAHGVALGGTAAANSTGAKTALTLAWFERARDRGLLMDFNGANSPDLADYKHSLAADPALYFRCNWHKP